MTITFNSKVQGDDGWTGSDATDPMGTLKAGQAYTLDYNRQNNAFSVTGFNEGTNAPGTWTYAYGSSPSSAGPNYKYNEPKDLLGDNKISMWGREYTIKEVDGELP
ncbi:MAG TPA: hypothetical protein V6C52_14835 [Coleofasciculaceae cyanobacterium]